MKLGFHLSKDVIGVAKGNLMSFATSMGSYALVNKRI